MRSYHFISRALSSDRALLLQLCLVSVSNLLFVESYADLLLPRINNNGRLIDFFHV